MPFIARSYYYSALVFLFVVDATLGGKIVCYYASWALQTNPPEDLDFAKCTHVNYAFGTLTESGTLAIRNPRIDLQLGGFNRTVAIKLKHKKIKVLLSISGDGSSVAREIFAKVASSQVKREKFLKSARDIVEKYGFDGVDIDWEVPRLADKENFMSLLREFREDFDKDNWEVTAAVSSHSTSGYNITELSRLLDHINLMTYDMYGPWSNHTGQNSPLFASSHETKWERNHLNMKSSVDHWIKEGADRKKLIAGIAFYGRIFTLANASLSTTGLHQPIIKPGKLATSMSYSKYCELMPSWNCTWDDEQKMPYCRKDDQWIGFDNVKSIIEKTKFVKQMKLGGIMIWSVDKDDIKGACGSPSPLLGTIYNGFQ